MDINFLRGLSTLLVFIGFIGVCISVYRPSQKSSMQEAANLPFNDGEADQTMNEENQRG